MRVFLVGEGPHDIGDLADAPDFRGKRPGFLQPMVEKIVGARAAFDGSKVALLGKKRVSRRGEALEAQAERAAVLAINAESELLVFVRDLDRGSGRRNAAADIQCMSDEIRRGSGCRPDDKLTCVPGVACRTIEAWALGDGDAVAIACGLDDAVGLPGGKKPEQLWGKPRDPASNHPKMVLKRIFGDGPDREDFAAIAEHADIDAMRDSCPLSFAPFVAELEAAT